MIDLLELEHDALAALLATWDEPGYRADQVWGWLYTRLAADPKEMTNLPKTLRARLAAETRIGGLTTRARQASQDSETVKWLFQLPHSRVEIASSQKDAPRNDELGITASPAPAGAPPEGAQTESKIEIETVLMRYRDRRTACISSQAGCAMGCTFCATGQMGLQRDLSAGEIVAQVLFVARELAHQDERLTNVVLMGMGEPLANYDATLAAIHRLTDPDGFNMGQRRITLSTVGLVPGIGRLSREGLQINLAVSLHAATDTLRDTLVPLNRRYPLDQLMAVCSEYFERTGRRVTFEWALIDGVNDSLEQARALAERVRGQLACHVNLIPLNPTASYPGMPASPEQVAAFGAELSRHSISNTVRVRRGIDIQAGCGQLRERMGHTP